MAATVMTVEFGTIQHYSSLVSEACVTQFFGVWIDENLTENYINCDILIQNKHVINSNMNTNSSLILTLCMLHKN